MLKKSMTIAMVSAIMFCFTMVTAGVSFAKNTGPETIILKTAKARKPASFPHRMHQAMLPCKTCHHTRTADGKQGPYVAGQEAKCITCHNKSFPNKKLNGLKKAAHARCRVCHKKMKKEGNKKAPTKCSGCHLKGLK